MGFYDRDYMRTPLRPARPAWWPKSITGWLIAINIAVFVLDAILARMGVRYILWVPTEAGLSALPLPPLEGLGHFSEALAIERLQVWRFITFQFLHGGIEHLLFNMLALYFFGSMVE